MSKATFGWQIFLCSFVLLLASKGNADPTLGMNIGGEGEVKMSSFSHNPRPEDFASGGNLGQQYFLLLDGGMGQLGYLDSILGLGMGDKYRTGDADIQNKAHLEYGPWLEAETERKTETDEDNFFSSSTEIPSPIYTDSKKYKGRLSMNKATSVDYEYADHQRSGLIPGSATGEHTRLHTVRGRRETRPLKVSGEYRKRHLDDLLGIRSDVNSDDVDVEVYYHPKEFFSILSVAENSKDVDLNKLTELVSALRRFELSVKPGKQFKVRNRISSWDDRDTQTGENIARMGNELIFNFDPFPRSVGFEYAVNQVEEEKEKQSADISASITEQRARVRLVPVRFIILQGGYELSEKESSSEAENTNNAKVVGDISIEPVRRLRISGQVSNSTQENPLRSLIESETNSISGTVHYQPVRPITLFVQMDNTETDNRSTGAFTKTDTISSSIRVYPLPFLSGSLRTSAQSTEGSSEEAGAERLLNATQITVRLLEDLKVSGEYEIISSAGNDGADEDLYDLGVFYNIGRFDFSVRWQKREMAGEKSSHKASLLAQVKYRVRNDTSVGLRCSMIDYTDATDAGNSYDSLSLESILSAKF